MSALLLGPREDWLWLDERIATVTTEIAATAESEPESRTLMSIPGLDR